MGCDRFMSVFLIFRLYALYFNGPGPQGLFGPTDSFPKAILQKAEEHMGNLQAASILGGQVVRVQRKSNI